MPLTQPTKRARGEDEEEAEEEGQHALSVKRDAPATTKQMSLITDHFVAAPLCERVRDVELVVWL